MRKRRDWSELDSNIVKLRDQGISQASMAQILKLPQSTVSYRFKIMGLTTPRVVRAVARVVTRTPSPSVRARLAPPANLTAALMGDPRRTPAVQAPYTRSDVYGARNHRADKRLRRF